jgi:hypothetical protein
MDKAAPLFLQLLTSLPVWFTIVLGLGSLGISAYVYFKQISIKEATSVGDIQSKQVEMLISQLTAQSSELHSLSEQLSEARKELRELYEQNVDLMKRIRELEEIIRSKP